MSLMRDVSAGAAKLPMYHICRTCHQCRSRDYHLRNPIPSDGIPPPPGICGRCQSTATEAKPTRPSCVEAVLEEHQHFPSTSSTDGRAKGHKSLEDKKEMGIVDNSVDCCIIGEREASGSTYGATQVLQVGHCQLNGSRVSLHAMRETASQIGPGTDMLYLAGRGRDQSGEAPSAVKSEHFRENIVRKIARQEIERSRKAERLLNSHPRAYAHGRMVYIGGDSSGQNKGWNASSPCHTVVQEDAFRPDPKENNLETLERRTSEEVAVKVQKSQLFRGQIHKPSAMPSPRLIWPKYGDFTEIPFGKQTQEEADAGGSKERNNTSRQKPSNRNDEWEACSGMNRRPESQTRSNRSSHGRKVERIRKNSYCSVDLPYPTQDRQHIRLPSPSTSELFPNDDKTKWPTRTTRKDSSPPTSNVSDENEYIYIKRVARVVSPSWNGSSHGSPQRSGRRRHTQSRDRHELQHNPRLPSPSRLINDIRARSPAYTAYSRRRNSSRSQHASNSSSPQRHGVTYKPTHKEAKNPSHMISDMQLNSRRGYRIAFRHSAAPQDHVTAGRNAAHGPYREISKLTESMSALDGSIVNSEECSIHRAPAQSRQEVNIKGHAR